MDAFTPEELTALMEDEPGACVSAFMPTHRAGPRIPEDRKRFKALLGRAATGLEALGLRSPRVQAVLAPARTLLEDGLFWQRQSDGLAVFLAADRSRRYRVPLPLKELVVVAPRFDPKPLLPLLTAAQRFHLLAVSLKRARLFQGDRFALRELALPGAPEGLKDTLRYDDLQKDQVQFHTQSPSPGGGGRRPPVFHGTGEADRKDEIARYFREVDAALAKRLKGGETSPLVLAGVDYLLPLYREASDHPAVLAAGIEGNPDNPHLGELHAKAWELARPRLEADLEAALERFGAARPSGRALSSVPQAVQAAFQGRVETLLVNQDREVWGLFDSRRGHASVHRGQNAGDEDLLAVAALHTLATGGSVFPVEESRMPEGAPLAAILRF